MEQEKQNIRIKIGEKAYPMRINANEEEKFRQASKMAQDLYIKYKQSYSTMSVDDILAMALLDLAKKNIDLLSHKGHPEFFLELSDIVNTLDEYIKAQ